MIQKEGLISIGMPIYNGEKYASEAIQSILQQTHSNFELIISDNASTDMTEIICREYQNKDSRIRCVRQSKNRGGPEAIRVSRVHPTEILFPFSNTGIR